MIFLGAVGLILDLVFWLVDFLPLPSFSDWSVLSGSLSQVAQLVPNAVGMIFQFLGPGVFTVFRIVWNVYLLGWDFLLGLLAISVLWQAVKFLKSVSPF